MSARAESHGRRDTITIIGGGSDEMLGEESVWLCRAKRAVFMKRCKMIANKIDLSRTLFITRRSKSVHGITKR